MMMNACGSVAEMKEWNARIRHGTKGIFCGEWVHVLNWW